LTLAGGAGGAAERSGNVWRDLLKKKVEARVGVRFCRPPVVIQVTKATWNCFDVGMV